MKNKIFIISSLLLALAFAVSSCSLSGGTQNTPITPQAAAPETPAPITPPISTVSDNNTTNNTTANTSTVTPTPPPAPVSAPAATVSTPSAKSNSAINIQGFAFSPTVLTIKKGTTVTWTNNDSAPHQIKSASFNSDTLSKGQTFSFTFNDAGSFNYSCAIHPSMTGQIIVE